MRRLLRIASVVIWPSFVALCGSITALAANLPAFPGAQGFGATTPGGRGGKVYEVTTLDDHGPGSLREAINADGPRTIVFRVSGTIKLDSEIEIKHPRVTIAGQTAPGDGICLRGQTFRVAADDCIIRYLRFRRGDETGVMGSGLRIHDCQNVIVDHCSVSWSCDEGLNTWHGTRNVTIQWCLVSEALHDTPMHAGHGFAASLGGTNTSYHHNLLANCPGRNPSIAGNDDFQTNNLDFRNNVVFNWQDRVIDGKPCSINFVANYYKPGPASRFTDHIAKIDDPAYVKIGTPKWYVAGNLMEGRPDILADNRKGVIGRHDFLVSEPINPAPIREDKVEELLPLVLSGAGAVLPRRDAVDLRAIHDAQTGQTTYRDGVVNSQNQVGGWPVLESKPPQADSDHNGIPDWWERKYGLDPNDPTDAAKDANCDGYTNLEKYLNGLDPTKKIDWTDPQQNVNTLTLERLWPSSK
jgi:pectate lyase